MAKLPELRDLVGTIVRDNAALRRTPLEAIQAAEELSADLEHLGDRLVGYFVEQARLDGAIKTARLVAHELNNQLSLLTGYGELLADDGEGETAEFARGIVRGARASAETIARLQRIIRFEEIDGGADYPMLDLEASTAPGEEV
jgi:hypothetical protein